MATADAVAQRMMLFATSFASGEAGGFYAWAMNDKHLALHASRYKKVKHHGASPVAAS